MGVASIVLSMIVNAYATGLIAFKLFKMQRDTKPTLGTLSSSGGIKYRSVISIIIESGVALFCIQLIRVVLIVNFEMTGSDVPLNALEIVIPIHEIFNVSTLNTSIILVIATTGLVGYNTYHHPSAGLNGIVLLQRGIYDRIYHDREFGLCVETTELNHSNGR